MIQMEGIPNKELNKIKERERIRKRRKRVYNLCERLGINIRELYENILLNINEILNKGYTEFSLNKYKIKVRMPEEYKEEEEDTIPSQFSLSIYNNDEFICQYIIPADTPYPRRVYV